MEKSFVLDGPLPHNTRCLLYYTQGKYDEADPLFLRVIEIYEKSLGPDHPHLAVTLNNRAGLLCKQVRQPFLFFSGAIFLWYSVVNMYHI